MIGHIILAAWLSACTADATTTHYDATVLGTHEANPLAPSNPFAIDAMVAGEVVLGTVLLHKTHGRPSRKVVVAAMLLSAAAHGWAAQHNYKLARY